MKLFPILLTLLFLSCCSPKSSESPLHSDPLKLTNVKYGPYERNVMDVYLPKNRTRDTPFVINLHGGAWTVGDKSNEHLYQNIYSQKALPSPTSITDMQIAQTHIFLKYWMTLTMFSNISLPMPKNGILEATVSRLLDKVPAHTFL